MAGADSDFPHSKVRIWPIVAGHDCQLSCCLFYTSTVGYWHIVSVRHVEGNR